MSAGHSDHLLCPNRLLRVNCYRLSGQGRQRTAASILGPGLPYHLFLFWRVFVTIIKNILKWASQHVTHIDFSGIYFYSNNVIDHQTVESLCEDCCLYNDPQGGHAHLGTGLRGASGGGGEAVPPFSQNNKTQRKALFISNIFTPKHKVCPNHKFNPAREKMNCLSQV